MKTILFSIFICLSINLTAQSFAEIYPFSKKVMKQSQRKYFLFENRLDKKMDALAKSYTEKDWQDFVREMILSHSSNDYYDLSLERFSIPSKSDPKYFLETFDRPIKIKKTIYLKKFDTQHNETIYHIFLSEKGKLVLHIITSYPEETIISQYAYSPK